MRSLFLVSLCVVCQAERPTSISKRHGMGFFFFSQSTYKILYDGRMGEREGGKTIVAYISLSAHRSVDDDAVGAADESYASSSLFLLITTSDSKRDHLRGNSLSICG